MLVLFSCFLFFFGSYVGGYNILGLFPYPAKSHYAVFDPLMVELAKRGHNVTIYDTFPKEYRIPNYTEISVKSCFSLPNILTIDQMNDFGFNDFRFITALFHFVPNYQEISTCEPLQKLLNSNDKYDVLITETFNTDFFVLFGAKMRIPVIGFHSNTALPWLSERMGLPDNPSYIPFSYISDPIDFSFCNRIKNTMLKLYASIVYKVLSQNVFDEMAIKFYGSQIAPLEEAVKNMSLLFLYSHFSLNPSRPLVPNVIEVAGLNLVRSKSLPQVCLHFFFFILFTRIR